MILRNRIFLPFIFSLIAGYSSNSCAETTWIPISNGGISFVIPLIPDDVFASPKNISRVYQNNELKFIWDDIQHASKYQIQGQKADGTWVDIKVSTINEVVIDESFDGYLKIRIVACNFNTCDQTGLPSDEVYIDTNEDFAEVTNANINNEVVPDNDSPLYENIGTIQGQAGVSGGAATYHIPIELAPGRAGMQPNVSLNYSSRSGNGIAGVGWSLSAGQSITRCPATFAQDGFTQNPQYNRNDKLCFNGQRLMLTSGSTYGASGAVYRTEIDSFVRVTQSGGLNGANTSFTVEYKNGRTAVFGESDDSRVVHEGKAAAYSWLIQYEYDATGNNYINYEYEKFGDGERLLTSINYTANDSSTAGQQSVVFYYQNKDEERSGYVAGGYYELTKRLHQVVTRYTDSWITKDVNTYTLNYQKSAATSRDLLRSIEQCMGSYCFPITEFSWQDSAQVIKKEHISVKSADLIQLNLPVADRNGDGAKDWPGLYITPEGTETTNSHPTNSCDYGAQINCNLNTVDVNLDGYSDNIDLIQSGTAKTLKLILNEGNGQSSSISTNISLEVLASILAVSDYNGDSFPDIIVMNKFASSEEDELLIYYHSGDVSEPYSESDSDLLASLSKNIPSNPHTSKLSVVSTSDLDGDGINDFYFTNGFMSNNEPVKGQPPIESIYFTKQSGDGSISLSRSGISLYSGDYNNDYGSYTRFYFFADVNGDGLKDWLGWENPNSREKDRINIYVRYNEGGSFTSSIDTGIVMPSRRFVYMSKLGGMGDEIYDVMFEPAYKGALQVGDVNNDGKEEVLFPNNVVIEHCITAVLNSGFEEGEVCGNNFNRDAHEKIGYGDYAYVKSLSDEHDRSIYQYKMIALNNGMFTSSKSHFYGARNHTALVDGQGDGLLDMVFHYGLWCDSDTSNVCNFKTNPLSGFAEGVVNISRNYGSGDGTSSADYAAIDMLKSVTNGVGYQSNWSYRPLSSEVNANINNVSKLYIKGDNYQAGYQNFTSSMYVVNSFEQSDGLDGLRERNYAYRGAVYNSRGRGFMGFKSIVEQDQISGVVTQTDFSQEFPYQGKIERQATFTINDYTKNGVLLGDTETNALSLSKYTWIDNPNHNRTNIYHIYPSEVIKKTYNLANKALLTTHTTSNNGIDAYGNITDSTVIIDDEGLTRYETNTVRAYDNNANTWFINRLTSSTVTKTSADDTKTSSTVLSNYHANRRPETVVLREGSIYGTELKTTTTAFNDYGLPTSITESADTYKINGAKQRSSRTSTISYTKNGTSVSADGYFPFTATNAKGHTVTTHTNPATGQPTKMRKQIGASAYLDTVYGYDDFNRLYSVQTGGQPIRYTAVQTPDNRAPANAVMQIVTKSAGTPTTKVYKDKLGRTLRTAVQGFASNSWIYNDVHYNNKGQVTFESVPFKDVNSPTTLGVSYSGFDELGRPQYKVTSQSCSTFVDGTMTAKYTYEGFTTKIDVEETCNSLTLPTMSRTYNSQKQLMSTVDAIGGKTTYSYNSLGLPTVIQDANDDSIVARYDSFGRKTSVNDPNQGYTQFTYNGFGELQAESRKQTANSSAHTIVRYAVDALGRVTKRRATGETDLAYNYDTASYGYGQLGSESGNGVTRTYAFDSFGRPTTTTIAGSSKSYTISTLYDANFGRVKGLRYPNNLTVKYEYNTRGFLTHIKNAANGYVYQNITEMDKFGNIASSTLGNGLTESNLYYAASGQMANKTVNKTGQGQILNINYSAYDGFGNLKGLTVNTGPIGDRHSFSESFEYDDLHRLTSNQIAGITTTSYRYDSVGNITYKSDYATTYDYDNHVRGYSGGGNNAVKKVRKTNGVWVGFSYDARGNMTKGDGLTEALYNAMDKPTSITKNGITNTFVYGPDHMRFKQTKSTGSTIYYADKLYEEEVKNGETTWRAYIGDVAVVSKSDNGFATIRYTHRDRLGSARLFTDRNGYVEAQRNFDPFGKPREASGGLKDENKLNDLDTAKTRRGFTDHEHLDEMELIHMNGRVYDYNLGRFMSVDPFIQDPASSQSINPYSYIMNNPLAGTDPTGYLGCAASSINETCAKLSNREGGFKEQSAGAQNIGAFAASYADASLAAKGSTSSLSTNLSNGWQNTMDKVNASVGLTDIGAKPIGEVPGYPETGSSSWRASNDQVFTDAVNAYNHKYGFSPGDDGFWTPQLLKAQAMIESGGSKSAFLSDPLQVNVTYYNTDGTIKSTDWVPGKLKHTELKGPKQKMTPKASAKNALMWLRYKGWRQNSLGNKTTYRGNYSALFRYNGNDNKDKVLNGKTVEHRVWYATTVLKLAKGI